MFKVTMVCQWCGQKFDAKRKSAKYCSERCKQLNKNAKNGVSNVIELNVVKASSLVSLARRFFNDSRDDDMILSTLPHIEAIQHELNKMIAYIGTIESEQANTWYQCQKCGQRTFGRVQSCDFCQSEDFERIMV